MHKYTHLLLSIYLELQLLGNRVCICSALTDSAKLFSKVAVPIYPPTMYESPMNNLTLDNYLCIKVRMHKSPFNSMQTFHAVASNEIMCHLHKHITRLIMVVVKHVYLFVD